MGGCANAELRFRASQWYGRMRRERAMMSSKHESQDQINGHRSGGVSAIFFASSLKQNFSTMPGYFRSTFG